MKRKLLLALSLCLALATAITAQVPQGMNYQAVARDKEGKPLLNQQISLQISLYASGSQDVYYTETHSVTTGAFGLFSLVIGEGTVVAGSFKDIPWSQNEIWVKVAVKSDGQT